MKLRSLISDAKIERARNFYTRRLENRYDSPDKVTDQIAEIEQKIERSKKLRTNSPAYETFIEERVKSTLLEQGELSAHDLCFEIRRGNSTSQARVFRILRKMLKSGQITMRRKGRGVTLWRILDASASISNLLAKTAR